eukprot:m.124840 g.124840  ORF g.124840 m.124840 type:complete len:115 (+) comp9359_c0_seq1:3347-3691(+)
MQLIVIGDFLTQAELSFPSSSLFREVCLRIRPLLFEKVASKCGLPSLGRAVEAGELVHPMLADTASSRALPPETPVWIVGRLLPALNVDAYICFRDGASHSVVEHTFTELFGSL